jgi:hypothetical protein
MSWSQNVFSSHVNTIAYDDSTGEMIVTWDNGRRSAYSNVSEEMAQQIANAPSVGSMLHSEIKSNPGRYPHRYIG